MTPIDTPVPSEFRLHDDVRLLDDHDDVRSGALGCILGRYARELGPTYLVRFGDQVCNDVRFEEIVIAGDLAASV
jgi:hypothetical protein